MSSRLLHGDCVEKMRELDECSVDAVVTDPPYGLEFMGKGWDRLGLAMQEWHHAWATEALRVLKPGGHALAFGGTRTYHRLACGLEDAGFEIRDCLAWLYGSGFPKSHNLGGDWQGWGTALKPAHEPIVVARKPLAGTVAANVLEHGTGAINVDGCRIGFADEVDERESKDKNRHADFESGEVIGYHGWDSRGAGGNYDPEGRWPANVVLDEEAAAMLDEQSGESVSSGGAGGGKLGARIYGQFENGTLAANAGGLGDRGGASRFFYCAKASKAERNAGLVDGNAHPTVKPIALMRWLVRLVTPPGGTVLDPFLGSGTTGIATALEGFGFVGIERDAEYLRIAGARIAHWTAQPQQLELGGA